jgi:hypothetical protein
MCRIGWDLGPSAWSLADPNDGPEDSCVGWSSGPGTRRRNLAGNLVQLGLPIGLGYDVGRRHRGNAIGFLLRV